MSSRCPDLQRRVLRQIQSLITDPDLDDGDVELRARQLAEHVGGTSCAELAFDPLARELDDIAARLVASPDGGHSRARWRDEVIAVVQRAVDQRARIVSRRVELRLAGAHGPPSSQ